MKRVGRTRRILAAGARQLGEGGYAVAGAGNISFRDGERVLISRSGLRFAAATPGDFASVDLGTGRSAGPRPSSELGMHLGLHRASKGPAIVHYHGRFSTALGLVMEELPVIHYSAHRLGGFVRMVDYHLFGSPELAEAVCQAAEGGGSAAILKNHGAVVWAESVAAAVESALLLEWLCEVYWRAHLIGTPRTLSADELNSAREQSARIRYSE